MAQAASKTCEICVCSPGHNYCEQCDQLFCDGCKVSHLRSKMAMNHTFLSGTSVTPQVKQYCKEHNESFIYYCKECDVPICKMCVIQNHKSHDFGEIKESTEGVKAEVKKVIDTKIRNLQSNIAEIEQISNKYQADVCEVIQTIRKEGMQLVKLINKKVKGLVRSVKEQETKKLQTLQSADTAFKTSLDKAKEQHKLFEETQSITVTTERLKKIKQIKSQIDLIKINRVPVMSFVKYASKKEPSSEIEKMFGDLTFGEIVKSEENTKRTEDVRETNSSEEFPKDQRDVREIVKSEENPKHQKDVRETVQSEDNQEHQQDVREIAKSEENTKYQKDVRETTTTKQYRYRCAICRTEIFSETKPACNFWSTGKKGAFLPCKECGKKWMFEWIDEL